MPLLMEIVESHKLLERRKFITDKIANNDM